MNDQFFLPGDEVINPFHTSIRNGHFFRNQIPRPRVTLSSYRGLQTAALHGRVHVADLVIFWLLLVREPVPGQGVKPHCCPRGANFRFTFSVAVAIRAAAVN